MQVETIIRALEERYPRICAEDWDNPGLLIGRASADVERVLVTLDVTDGVVQQAIDAKANLIVSHHPLIFHAIRDVSDESFLGHRILNLTENGIAVFAMHTNFDVCKMGDLNAAQLQLQDAEVLDVTGVDAYDLEEGLGKIGNLAQPMRLSAFAAFVKERLQLPEVRLFGPETDDPEIARVAICGGSGRSTIPCALEKGAQVLVTGDLDHHTALDAMAEGLWLIDAGHYGTEICFVEHVADELAELFPSLSVLRANTTPPYRVV